MLRRAMLVALISAVSVGVAAQGPAGWKVRPDAGNATLSAMPTEKGFQVTGGPGIFWNPANTVKPIYRVRATFTQLKAPAKNTYYGLFVGGNEMEAAAGPTYVYFAIAQDGSFIIRHRAGAQVDDMDKSLHFAIKKPDASGKAVNTLEVQVAPTAVSYLINGAVADATPTRAGMGSFTQTDKIGGVVGVRIDDPIDVQVDGFFFESPFQLNERGQ